VLIFCSPLVAFSFPSHSPPLATIECSCKEFILPLRTQSAECFALILTVGLVVFLGPDQVPDVRLFFRLSFYPFCAPTVVSLTSVPGVPGADFRRSMRPYLGGSPFVGPPLARATRLDQVLVMAIVIPYQPLPSRVPVRFLF